MNYTDPTGHFDESAIDKYLQDNFDDWEAVKKEWQSNSTWWDMLIAAEGGSVLMFTNTDIGSMSLFRFLGDGQTLLSGLERVDGMFNTSDHPTQGANTLQSIFKFYSLGVFEGMGLLKFQSDGNPYFEEETCTGDFHYDIATYGYGEAILDNAAVFSIFLGATVLAGQAVVTAAAELGISLPALHPALEKLGLPGADFIAQLIADKPLRSSGIYVNEGDTWIRVYANGGGMREYYYYGVIRNNHALSVRNWKK